MGQRLFLKPVIFAFTVCQRLLKAAKAPNPLAWRPMPLRPTGGPNPAGCGAEVDRVAPHASPNMLREETPWLARLRPPLGAPPRPPPDAGRGGGAIGSIPYLRSRININELSHVHALVKTERVFFSFCFFVVVVVSKPKGNYRLARPPPLKYRGEIGVGCFEGVFVFNSP